MVTFPGAIAVTAPYRSMVAFDLSELAQLQVNCPGVPVLPVLLLL
jgi:hypothetical protein